MNIYEFDLWESDKGIILAESEEKALELLTNEYGNYGNLDNYESYCLNYVSRSTDKGLFVFE